MRLVEALKKLYVTFGGVSTDVANTKTISGTLKKIYSVLGGAPLDIDSTKSVSGIISKMGDLDVSVGGNGDFQTFEMTYANYAPGSYVAVVPFIDEYQGDVVIGFSDSYVEAGEGVYNVIAYKGNALLKVVAIDNTENLSLSIRVSGSAEVMDDQVLITGDCSVEIDTDDLGPESD